MVCGSGIVYLRHPPPPIRAVRASSQASRAAGHLASMADAPPVGCVEL